KGSAMTQAPDDTRTPIDVQRDPGYRISFWFRHPRRAICAVCGGPAGQDLPLRDRRDAAGFIVTSADEPVCTRCGSNAPAGLAAEPLHLTRLTSDCTRTMEHGAR